jgi:hypothetical protein
MMKLLFSVTEVFAGLERVLRKRQREGTALVKLKERKRSLPLEQVEQLKQHAHAGESSESLSY